MVWNDRIDWHFRVCSVADAKFIANNTVVSCPMSTRKVVNILRSCFHQGVTRLIDLKARWRIIQQDPSFISLTSYVVWGWTWWSRLASMGERIDNRSRKFDHGKLRWTSVRNLRWFWTITEYVNNPTSWVSEGWSIKARAIRTALSMERSSWTALRDGIMVIRCYSVRGAEVVCTLARRAGFQLS